MHTRVTVFAGMLYRHDVIFPLTCEDTGAPATGDHVGPAWLADGRLVLGDPATQAHLACYRVGDATPDSLVYRNGKEYAAQQARCCMPRGKPEAFVDGWRAGWQERDPSRLPEARAMARLDAAERRAARAAAKRA